MPTAGQDTTVGIMSMQRIFNYGSSLQAYALKRLVEDAAGDVRVGFLDYRPGPTLGGSADDGGFMPRALTKVLEYGATTAPVVDRLRFLRHKWRYGSQYFDAVEIPRDTRHDTDVDVQIIGSDEVFNCVQDNSRVGYSRDLFGRGSRAVRLTSYAASFGNTTLDKVVEAGIEAELRDDLSRFDRISVRDENSRSIVEELTGSSPPVHMDPTLAYRLMEREQRIPAGRVHAAPYIVVYGYSGRLSAAENAAVRRYADARGVEVLSFGGLQPCADRFVDCDPFTLLAFFRDAEAVVTDTFHGTIFSIITERPFCSIVRTSDGESYGNEQKLGYLLDTLALADRACTTPEMIADVLDRSADFADTRRVVEAGRSRAQEYLHDIVSA